MTNHDPEQLDDVADGDQVVDGVDPPTADELARYAAAEQAGVVEAEIDAHVGEVNIHDGRDR